VLHDPGRYCVSAQKCYARDGASAGLDAWTGMVFSEPIEIEVAESKRAARCEGSHSARWLARDGRCASQTTYGQSRSLDWRRSRGRGTARR